MTNNEIVPGFDDERSDYLRIKLHHIDEVKKCLLIFLTGYVDTYNSVLFQRKIQKAIDAGFTNLIFECNSLNYVSSTGIGSFTAFLKSVKPQGGDIILLEMHPKVYEVFHMLGFSKFFNINYSIDDSINYLKTNRVMENSSVFPALVTCPICVKKLKAAKSGRFRCSECKSIIDIDDSGFTLLG